MKCSSIVQGFNPKLIIYFFFSRSTNSASNSKKVNAKFDISRRKYRVRPIFQKREEFGVFKTLYPELKAD